MANTTNFGWETPDDTDLVKDGALAMRTLGNAIDTSLVDLKGGTTGQVLSKNTNTDMDFTWVTPNDADAIQNSIVDAKGDLIAASANDTPARLAVGNNGDILVADSSTTTGLRWQGNFAAGKNKIINGDFSIWQRGTSFLNNNNGYAADRWIQGASTANPTSWTVSQQSFTAGTAPVSGYEGTFFLRSTITTVGTASNVRIMQRIEDVRSFAGQDVTISFWAKNDSTRNISTSLVQTFGTGGSAAVSTSGATSSIGTSWTRYTSTISVPSISGKTIGAGSYLELRIIQASVDGSVMDIWGVQVEPGNVATAFQTAAASIQGELELCQRYYVRFGGQSVYQVLGNAYAASATKVYGTFSLPVSLRTIPTTADFSTLAFQDSSDAISGTFSAIALDSPGLQTVRINATTTGQTAGRPGVILTNNSTNGFIAFIAEL